MLSFVRVFGGGVGGAHATSRSSVASARRKATTRGILDFVVQVYLEARRTRERWGCLRAENEAEWVLVPQEPDLGHTSGGKRSTCHAGSSSISLPNPATVRLS